MRIYHSPWLRHKSRRISSRIAYRVTRVLIFYRGFRYRYSFVTGTDMLLRRIAILTGNNASVVQYKHRWHEIYVPRLREQQPRDVILGCTHIYKRVGPTPFPSEVA
jgi:hypothetical protein